MKFYYNEKTNSFAVYNNFVPKEKPKGYKEITKAKYEELQKKMMEETEEGEENV